MPSCTTISLPLTLTAALLLGACANSHSVVEHKTPSLKHLKPLGIATAEPFVRRAMQNTSTVFSGWEISTSGSPTPDNPWNEGAMSGTIAPGFEGTPTVSSAVPITHDGYFLTAAHSVDDPDHLKIITATRSRGLVAADLRVVWSDPDLEPDIALVHAPVRTWTHLPLTETTDPSTGDLVVVSGWSAMDAQPRSSPTRSLSAGHILEISAPKNDPSDSSCSYRVISHDAPCHSGDSGGPLISTTGLLGVQSHGLHATWFSDLFDRISPPDRRSKIPSYQAVAYAPDPGWISALIADDRRIRSLGRSRSRPTP